MSDDDEITEPTTRAVNRKAGRNLYLPPGMFPPVIAGTVEAFGLECTERDPIKAARTRQIAKQSRKAYDARQKKINRKR